MKIGLTRQRQPVHVAYAWERSTTDPTKMTVHMYVDGEYVDTRVGDWRDPGNTVFIGGGGRHCTILSVMAFTMSFAFTIRRYHQARFCTCRRMPRKSLRLRATSTPMERSTPRTMSFGERH